MYMVGSIATNWELNLEKTKQNAYFLQTSIEEKGWLFKYFNGI